MRRNHSQSDGNGEVDLPATQSLVADVLAGWTGGVSKFAFEIPIRNIHTVWSIPVLAWAAVSFHWPPTYEGTTQKRPGLA